MKGSVFNAHVSIYKKKQVVQLKQVDTPAEHISLFIPCKKNTCPINPHVFERQIAALCLELEAIQHVVTCKVVKVCKNSSYIRMYPESFELFLNDFRESMGGTNEKDLPQEERPLADKEEFGDELPLRYHTSHSRQKNKEYGDTLSQEGSIFELKIVEIRRRK